MAGEIVCMHTGAFTPSGTGERTTFGGGIVARQLDHITRSIIDGTSRQIITDSNGIRWFTKGALRITMVPNTVKIQLSTFREDSVTFATNLSGFIVTSVPTPATQIKRGGVITHSDNIRIGTFSYMSKDTG